MGLHKTRLDPAVNGAAGHGIAYLSSRDTGRNLVTNLVERIVCH